MSSQRIGLDLIISYKENNVNKTAVIIKNYFQNEKYQH
jgi:hypothetical protein